MMGSVKKIDKGRGIEWWGRRWWHQSTVRNEVRGKLWWSEERILEPKRTAPEASISLCLKSSMNGHGLESKDYRERVGNNFREIGRMSHLELNGPRLRESWVWFHMRHKPLQGFEWSSELVWACLIYMLCIPIPNLDSMEDRTWIWKSKSEALSVVP